VVATGDYKLHSSSNFEYVVAKFTVCIKLWYASNDFLCLSFALLW
jgi:hypothetical protein